MIISAMTNGDDRADIRNKMLVVCRIVLSRKQIAKNTEHQQIGCQSKLKKRAVKLKKKKNDILCWSLAYAMKNPIATET